MSVTKLSADSFIGLIGHSRLIDPEHLRKLLKSMAETGVDCADPRTIANELIARNVITKWQAEKLLAGKHKGFFLGKYRLLSLLGTGGMSSVYLAEHVLMRRRVAVKILPQQRVDDSSYLQRFHREAQAVAALDHRNIVRAYDVDVDGKNHFLVMEYVSGKNLQDAVLEGGPLGYVAAAEYMRQAAEGLSHAHKAGLVHRDIKPGNLLLDEKGTVKLLDLGLARFFDDSEENSLTLRHDEKVLGTADYLSPEQAVDSHNVDIRSDIYSLGCTLFFALTGHPPFPTGTMAQRLLAHQQKKPEPISNDRPDAPAGLVAICDKMMAKQVADRYQTARENAQALQQWLSEHGGSEWAGMHPVIGVGASTISSGTQDRKNGPPASAAPLSSKDIHAGSSVLSAPLPAVAEEPPANADLAAFFTGLSAEEPRSAAKPKSPVKPKSKVLPKSAIETTTPPKLETAPIETAKAETIKTGPATAPTVEPAKPAKPAEVNADLASFFSNMGGASTEAVAPSPSEPSLFDPAMFAPEQFTPAASAPCAPAESKPPAVEPVRTEPIPTPAAVTSVPVVSEPAAAEQAGDLASFFSGLADEPISSRKTLSKPAAKSKSPPAKPADPPPAASAPQPAPTAAPVMASATVPAAAPVATPISAPASTSVAVAPLAVAPSAAPVTVAPDDNEALASFFGGFSSPAPEPPAVAAVAAAPRIATPVAAPAAGSVPVATAVARPVAVAMPVAGPVAAPVAQPAAASLPEPAPAKKKKGAALPVKPLMIGGAVLGGLALCYGVYAMFIAGKGPAKSSDEPAKTGAKATGGKTPQKGTSKSPGNAPREQTLEVGPGKTYATIAAALDFAKQNYNTSIHAFTLIKVAPGNYPERIVLDKTYHAGIQLESSSPDQPFVLNPPGSDPIVELREEYKRFQLKHARLEAKDRAKAVRIEGGIEATLFKQVSIEGFAGVGVSCEGAYPLAAGNTLEQVTFRPANPQAVGIRFAKAGELESVRLNVLGCNFIGPMTTGIEFETALENEISNTIFSDCTTGIRFLGSNKTWKSITFANNTFFRNTNGIVWEDLPAPGSDELGFYNNLFVQLKETAVVVQKNYDELKFSPMYATELGSGVDNNWTDAPLPAPAPKDSVRIFEGVSGKFAQANLQFVSLDPASPDFLVPVPGSPLITAQPNLAKKGAYVGARAGK